MQIKNEYWYCKTQDMGYSLLIRFVNLDYFVVIPIGINEMYCNISFAKKKTKQDITKNQNITKNKNI